MNKESISSTEYWLIGALLTGVVVLFIYNYYVFFSNSGNHIGMSVKIMGALYIVLAVMGWWLWQSHNRLVVVACVLVGLLGAVEIYALDYFNVMSSYDDWLKKRQPERIYGCWFLNC